MLKDGLVTSIWIVKSNIQGDICDKIHQFYDQKDNEHSLECFLNKVALNWGLNFSQLLVERFYIPNVNVIVGAFWPIQCLDYAMTHISLQYFTWISKLRNHILQNVHKVHFRSYVYGVTPANRDVKP